MSSKPPLGMPEGSVRALLALIIVVTVCALAFMGRTIPEVIGTALGMVLAAYYSQRNNPPPGPPAPPPGPPTSSGPTI